MAITEARYDEFMMAIIAWELSLSFPTFMRERAGGEVELDDVDAANAEADRRGLVWRKLLDDLLDGEDLDAAVIAHDVHAWGASVQETARRSAVSYINPGRPELGQVLLDGEAESQAARDRWVRPLVALLNRSTAA